MQGSEAKKNPGRGGPHGAVFPDHIDLTSKLKIKTIIVLLSGKKIQGSEAKKEPW